MTKRVNFNDKRRKYFDCKEVEATETTAEILTEPEIKTWYDLATVRFKSIFRIKSLKTLKEIDCVVWQNVTAHAGDTIHLIGQIKGNENKKCFVAWRYQILKRNTKKEELKNDNN